MTINDTAFMEPFRSSQLATDSFRCFLDQAWLLALFW